ncbi:MAG TPA: hypothetical protein VFB32_14025 [Rudaea sp.]|nr:hypothetical protein [Rudaea sp.]
MARQNLGALAIAAFALPALLLAVWLSTVGLAVVALHEGGLGWLSAAAIGCAAQLCFLYLLILRARRWLRELALTHSRFAVQQLLERVR